MNKILIAYIVGVASLLFLVQCSRDETISGEDNLPLEDVCNSVTYNGEIKAHIDNYCAYSGCHITGGPEASMESYSKLAKFLNNGSFTKEVITKRSMPPSYVVPNKIMPDSIYKKIVCWQSNKYAEK